MGAYTNGVYVPTIGEVGWGTNVNDFLTRSGEEYINVKQLPYAAVGDGVADDTVELQAAHDAALAGPMCVYVPKGVYNHTALTWDARVRLVGAGTTLDENANSGTYFNYTDTTGTALTVTNAGTGSGPHFENIGFLGSSAANNTIGIYLNGPGSVQTNMSHGMFHNVRVRKFGKGIKTSFTLEVVFLNVYAIENGEGLLLTNISNACSIIGGAYRQSTTNGVHLTDTSSVYIAPGVVIESNGASGLVIDGSANVSGFTIGGHYENNVRGIYLHGIPAGRILDSCIVGALFSANSGTDVDITSGQQIKGFGLYYVDNGSIALDSDSKWCEFYGSRPPAITDNGLGNYFFYPDSAVTGYLQLRSSTGYGVHFANGVLEMDEVSAPAAAPANHGYLYMRDTGGKTQLVARFPTGAAQVIATEP